MSRRSAFQPAELRVSKYVLAKNVMARSESLSITACRYPSAAARARASLSPAPHPASVRRTRRSTHRGVRDIRAGGAGDPASSARRSGRLSPWSVLLGSGLPHYPPLPGLVNSPFLTLREAPAILSRHGEHEREDA